MEAADTLHITMFGRFTMTRRVTGEVLTVTEQSSSSKKLWTFLEYLIAFRNKPIPQDELIDVLWGDEEVGNPLNTLKTLLHRARNTVETLGFGNGKQVLLCRRGEYMWSGEVDLTVDTEEFEALCEAASRPGPDCLGHMLAAIALYQGDFLPKVSREPWAVSLRVYYHAKFLALCNGASALLAEEGRYSEVVSLCRKAILIDPYDEAAHLRLMQAMISADARQAALDHYQYVMQLFMKQLGVTPSEDMTAFYRQLVKTSNSVKLDLHAVQRDLDEESPAPGPYCCEYAIFQDIYRLLARTASRTGQAVQLAALSVLDDRGKALAAKRVGMSMERVKEVILSGLRQGDVFTRFSATQYLLLLPYASSENGEKVLGRLMSRFRRAYPKTPVLLQYSLLPLLPVIIEDARSNKNGGLPA